jgi:bacterial/archaeal transporter family protein
MWLWFALGSAVFAALTSILAKVGIGDSVDSNLATAIRTVVVVVMAWMMVAVTNAQGGIADITPRSWLFLILSGLATGASWLCYFHALKIGQASQVVPVDKLSVVITLVLAAVFLRMRLLMRGSAASASESSSCAKVLPSRATTLMLDPSRT